MRSSRVSDRRAMLFFGVGTGRCGTMTVANLLNEEAEVCCLHEGYVRRGEDKADQILPYLTLQNLRAYHEPETAKTLFETAQLAAENEADDDIGM